MQREPLPLSNFPVNLRKHVDPASPVPLRMMAAKGVVPMAPQETALVLFQLSFDANGGVQKAAADTFRSTPTDLLETALGKTAPVAVLDWAAGLFPHNDDVLALIVTNANAGDETIERVAGRASAQICDLIADNQVRLLQAPDIIKAMYLNAEARQSTVDKMIDLARRNEVAIDMPALRPLLDSNEPIVEESVEARGVDEADAIFGQFLSEALFEEDLADEKDDEQGEEKKDHRRSQTRQHYLSTLRVPQKIRLAILGTREDRGYLVRDPNRLVHMAAVNSPKATEHDAINWSSNRTLPEGVVSYIAAKREWFRHYQVKLNLANNPKLPFRNALKLLPHLHAKDLQNLSRNRNVSHQLQRQAKALGAQRASGRRR